MADSLAQRATRRSISWDDFAAQIAEVAGVERSVVQAESRLVEDLNLDSLGLLEVSVVAVVDCGLEELPDQLQKTSWDGVTVGDVFEQCSNYVGPRWQMEWK